VKPLRRGGVEQQKRPSKVLSLTGWASFSEHVVTCTCRPVDLSYASGLQSVAGMDIASMEV